MTDQYRYYTVTVTPKFMTYAGTSQFGAYTVDYYAKDGADAISKARRQRFAEDGREAVPAKFSAKISENQEGR